MNETQPVPPQLPPPRKDPLIGMKLGDYVVESQVATGGMGLVYRARHPVLGRYAAVKVLRPEFARDEEQVSRFLKEAQAVSAIHHRGIIGVHNFGELPDGRQYMSMDYLDGETLEAVLTRDAPLPAARALPIIDEVLDALSAAHKVGVVHRDLKPSNVFITRESNGTRYAKLVDFGLAKQGEPMAAGAVQPFAKASLVAGTPEYISPEQARGFAATPRTDLYCLGVMMFEMLTGKLPFRATTVDGLLKQHVNDPAPRMTTQLLNAPEVLDDLVAQLLEKDPELRPQSADVVRQVIARVLKQMKEESTRQRSMPTAPPEPEKKTAPLETVGPTRQVTPAERRAVATTDVVFHGPPIQLGPSRQRPGLFGLALVLFMLGAAILTWAFWGGPKKKAVVTQVVTPPAVRVLPSQPLERTPVEPLPEHEVVAKVEVPSDELAPLKAVVARIPTPAVVVVAKPAEVDKPNAVALPPVPAIDTVGCEPTVAWKESRGRELSGLGSAAAKLKLDWSEDTEASLVKRIKEAASKNDCARAQADFDKISKPVVEALKKAQALEAR